MYNNHVVIIKPHLRDKLGLENNFGLEADVKAVPLSGKEDKPTCTMYV